MLAVQQQLQPGAPVHLRRPRPQRREGQRVLHDNRAGGAPTPCSSHTRARARLTPIHAGLAPLCACVPAHAAPTRLRPRDRALLLPRPPPPPPPLSPSPSPPPPLSLSPSPPPSPSPQLLEEDHDLLQRDPTKCLSTNIVRTDQLLFASELGAKARNCGTTSTVVYLRGSDCWCAPARCPVYASLRMRALVIHGYIRALCMLCCTAQHTHI